MEERRIQVAASASWRQMGVLVNDGSGSMSDRVDAGEFAGTKGQAVGLAVQGLLSRFQASRKAANFCFAGVTFDHQVHGEWAPTPASQVDLFRDYDPTVGAGGGTRIAAGLRAAESIVHSFLAASADGLPASSVVLLLTDGEDGDPAATREVAAQLTADPRVRLACAFLATKGQPPVGLGLLQSICSPPATRWCTTVYDPETLRKFWTASMTLAEPALPPPGAVAALPAGADWDRR